MQVKIIQMTATVEEKKKEVPKGYVKIKGLFNLFYFYYFYYNRAVSQLANGKSYYGQRLGGEKEGTMS